MSHDQISTVPYAERIPAAVHRFSDVSRPVHSAKYALDRPLHPASQELCKVMSFDAIQTKLFYIQQVSK